jgi:hypothetical protein
MVPVSRRSRIAGEGGRRGPNADAVLWLRVGAASVGVGAALLTGYGVAAEDAGADDPGVRSARDAGSHSVAAGSPKRPARASVSPQSAGPRGRSLRTADPVGTDANPDDAMPDTTSQRVQKRYSPESPVSTLSAQKTIRRVALRRDVAAENRSGATTPGGPTRAMVSAHASEPPDTPVPSTAASTIVTTTIQSETVPTDIPTTAISASESITAAATTPEPPTPLTILQGALNWLRRTFDNATPTFPSRTTTLSLTNNETSRPIPLGGSDADGDTLTYTIDGSSAGIGTSGGTLSISPPRMPATGSTSTGCRACCIRSPSVCSAGPATAPPRR